jgi:LPXTG-motif cell wall-anchored protein
MKIVGFVLLIVGVVLLFFGWQSSEGLDDQVSEAVTGEYTDSTMWYIILGVIAAAAGAFLAFFKK